MQHVVGAQKPHKHRGPYTRIVGSLCLRGFLGPYVDKLPPETRACRRLPLVEPSCALSCGALASPIRGRTCGEEDGVSIRSWDGLDRHIMIQYWDVPPYTNSPE